MAKSGRTTHISKVSKHESKNESQNLVSWFESININDTTDIRWDQFKWVCWDITIQYYHGHVIMSVVGSRITSLTIVYLTVYSGAVHSKSTSKLRVTGLCARNSPVTGEFPAQMASNAENVSIWWHHHDSINKHRITISKRRTSSHS